MTATRQGQAEARLCGLCVRNAGHCQRRFIAPSAPG
jgi:hypothetical protein